MKTIVYSELYYPVYQLGGSHPIPDGVMELSPDELADFERVFAEWEAWQDRIMAVMNPAPGPAVEEQSVTGR